MDAEPQLDHRLDQFPRNMFFQAVDYQVGPAALPEHEVKIQQNKRFADARRLHTQLEHLVRAVKSVDSFDPMGNAGLAAVNLDDMAVDVFKQIRNFVRSIEAAEDRYGDALAAEEETPAAVEPTPQAPTAAGPKPSDIAQVQANLNRALDRAAR